MKNLLKFPGLQNIPSFLLGCFLLFFLLIYNQFSATVYSPQGLFYALLLLGGICLLSCRYLSLSVSRLDTAILTFAVLYPALLYPCSTPYTYTILFLLFLYITICLIRPVNWRLLYGAVLFIILCLSMYGYLQLAELLPSGNNYFLITGPYKNPSVFAGIMVLLLTIPIAFVLTHIRYRRYTPGCMFSLLLIVVGLPLVLLAGSRASWLALIVVLFYLVGAVYKFRITCNLRNLVMVGCIGAICIMGLYGVYSYKKDSADGRLLIWRVSLEMIREKPLTGFGPGGITTHYMHYQARYLQEKGSERDHYVAGSNHLAYNEPIRICVEYGVVGLLLYIGLWIGVLLVPGRTIRVYGIKGVLIGYFVWGLFNFPAQVLPLEVVGVMALALLAGQVKPLYKMNHKVRLTGHIALLIVIGWLAGRQYQCSLSYQAYEQLTHHYKQYKEEELIARLADLETTLHAEPGYWAFYCTVLYQGYKDELLTEKLHHWNRVFPAPAIWLMSGDVSLRNQEYEQAEQSYRKAHSMIPSRQVPRGRLVWLYREMGREEEARLLAAEILSEKVKVYGFDTHILHGKLREAFGEDFTNNLINTKK